MEWTEIMHITMQRNVWCKLRLLSSGRNLRKFLFRKSVNLHNHGNETIAHILLARKCLRAFVRVCVCVYVFIRLGTNQRRVGAPRSRYLQSLRASLSRKRACTYIKVSDVFTDHSFTSKRRRTAKTHIRNE
jgi:hypothetical protein